MNESERTPEDEPSGSVLPSLSEAAPGDSAEPENAAEQSVEQGESSAKEGDPPFQTKTEDKLLSETDNKELVPEVSATNKQELWLFSFWTKVEKRLITESPKVVVQTKSELKRRSRRDFLAYGAGLTFGSGAFWWLLPEEVKAGLGIPSLDDPFKKLLLKGALDFDDLVARSVFSQTTLVPTFSKSQMTEVPNNYAGQTPEPSSLRAISLKVSGLASGKVLQLEYSDLTRYFTLYEQITRLVCVEGWSAISGWGGVRFADFIKRYPPRGDSRWIALRSDVNLDGDGNPDPYFVSLDIPSALHPQTLLATHHKGKPLEIEHGAPLRLLAPMKLGLKNIKAITSIEYVASEPPDYWNENGYSYYDGI